jgi:hypothetical protein
VSIVSVIEACPSRAWIFLGEPFWAALRSLHGQFAGVKAHLLCHGRQGKLGQGDVPVGSA